MYYFVQILSLFYSPLNPENIPTNNSKYTFCHNSDVIVCSIPAILASLVMKKLTNR